MISRADAPLVIVGDSLLDVDLRGASTRLSPETPVPVVDVGEQLSRPGGAGLAALLAARSHPRVILITALADDEAGRTLTRLLGDVVEVVPLPLAGSTVRKTRVSAGEKPLLRLDFGTGRAVPGDVPEAARAALEGAGAILVSDYGRGVTALPALRSALAAATKWVPVVWDPHPRGADPVPGVHLVTPNAAEAGARLTAAATEPDAGSALDSEEHTRGRALCRLWGVRGVAVTVGARGAYLTRADVEVTKSITPRPQATTGPVTDTCGAGDALAAAAASALLAGVDLEQAVQVGVDSATAYVLAGAASNASTRTPPGLPSSGPGARNPYELAADVRRSGRRLVATGGCFDLLHSGHVSLLERARQLGDALVVCLNSDASVRRAKGQARPVNAEQDRARVLVALAAVDAVAIFDEDTPAEVLDRLRPDVWVKGGDYTEATMPEADVVRRHGGEIVLLPLVPGHSTTRMAARLRLAPADPVLSSSSRSEAS